MTPERIQLIDDLGAEFRRVTHRPRRSRRLMATVVAMLCLSSAAAVAAVSGALPLGDALPVPDNLRVPPTAESERVSSLRVADPKGGPAWTIQFFDAGNRGCAQIGRIQGDTFGSVGAEGRFHPQAPGSASFACGAGSLASSGLQGAARTGPPGQRRFVRYGILGADVRSLVYLPASGTPRQLALTPEGAFLLVTEAQDPPEGQLVARYSDGEVRRGNVGLAGHEAFVPRK